MVKRAHLTGVLTTAFFAAVVLTATTDAGVVMRCSGGANSGEACSSDADCPGLCLHNANERTCGVDSPCPRVCKGGDTPGAECPEGLCPGICVGGENRGNPCTSAGDCPGSRCSAECRADRCKLGYCKTGGGHSESQPLSMNLGEESWDDGTLSACADSESGN